MPSHEWLIAVNVGSVAMIGIGFLFPVVWMVDRRRWYAVSFAGSILGFTLAGLAVSLPLGTAAGSSLHGVVYPIAVALLVDGVLRRCGPGLSRATAVGFVVVLAAGVGYFAFVQPWVVGRVVTQNAGMAALVGMAIGRVWRAGVPTVKDRVALAATCLLAVSCVVNLVCAAFSDVPRELRTDADVAAYLTTNLEYALIAFTAIVLPCFMITMLAVSVVDVIEDLRSQRDRDELTGLLNRWGFNHRAERLTAGAGCALALVDLDRFKLINDVLGHAVGDEVLVMVARELSAAPADNRIVGRLGGEEFAVLLPGADLAAAQDWAETTRRRIESLSLMAGDRRVTVTASFGITASAGPGDRDLPDLLELADRALYAAKACGRNRIASEPAESRHRRM